MLDATCIRSTRTARRGAGWSFSFDLGLNNRLLTNPRALLERRHEWAVVEDGGSVGPGCAVFVSDVMLPTVMEFAKGLTITDQRRATVFGGVDVGVLTLVGGSSASGVSASVVS